jgi:hypothetical protein
MILLQHRNRFSADYFMLSLVCEAIVSGSMRKVWRSENQTFKRAEM